MTTTANKTVPASEYDALCDLLDVIVDELTHGGDAVDVARARFGDHEAEWLRRVLAGARARELFSDSDERIVALLAEASGPLDAAAAEPCSPQRKGVIGALRVQLRQPVEASTLLLRPPARGEQGA